MDENLQGCMSQSTSCKLPSLKTALSWFPLPRDFQKTNFFLLAYRTQTVKRLSKGRLFHDGIVYELSWKQSTGFYQLL